MSSTQSYLIIIYHKIQRRVSAKYVVILRPLLHIKIKIENSILDQKVILLKWTSVLSILSREVRIRP